MIFAVNLVWVLFLISTMGDQITLCIESRYDPENTFRTFPSQHSADAPTEVITWVRGRAPAIG